MGKKPGDNKKKQEEKEPEISYSEASEEIGQTELKEEEDYKEKWLRSLADLENIRKRFEKEREVLSKYCLTGLILDLLPVVDNFYLAVQHIPQEQRDSSWVSGVQYIQKNLLDTLERYGVKEIALKPGDLFQAETQEAIGTIANGEVPEDHVVEVKRKGYYLHDRVIRPAQVVVSRGSSTNNKDEVNS